MSGSLFVLGLTLVLMMVSVYYLAKRKTDNRILKDITKVSVASALAIISAVMVIQTKGIFTVYSFIPLAFLIAAISDYVITKNFIAGMGIFSISYLLIPIGLFSMSHVGFNSSVTTILYAVLFGIIALFVALKCDNKIKIPVMIYLVIHFILQVVSCNNTLYYDDPFIVFGASFLLYSDLLIGVNDIYKDKIELADEVIMITYWLGLYFIFYSFTKLLAM